MTSRDNLGLSLNLQTDQVDRRYPGILEAPEDKKEANNLSADNKAAAQFPQRRCRPPVVTHQKSWCSGRAPLSLRTLSGTGERKR